MRYAEYSTTTKIVRNIIELDDQDTLPDAPVPAPVAPTAPTMPDAPTKPVLMLGGNPTVVDAINATYAQNLAAWQQTCDDLNNAYLVALDTFRNTKYKYQPDDGFAVVKLADDAVAVAIGVTTYVDGDFVNPPVEGQE